MGIVPNGLLLLLGILGVVLLLNPGFRATIAYEKAGYLLAILIALLSPLLHFRAFSRSPQRHGAIPKILAGLADIAMILFAVFLGRREFESLGTFSVDPPLVVFPALAISGLIALVLSQLASQERLTFSLRQGALAFVGMAIFLVGARWILTPEDMVDFRRQRALEREIVALGGRVSWRDWQIATVHYDSRKLSPPQLERLDELPGLRMLNLMDSNLSDNDMEHIGSLEQLYTLLLAGTGITDSGLAELQEMKELRTIMLSETLITDAGLEHLANLKKLEWLDLTDTAVTREGVNWLADQLPETTIMATDSDGVDYRIEP